MSGWRLIDEVLDEQGLTADTAPLSELEIAQNALAPMGESTNKAARERRRARKLATKRMKEALRGPVILTPDGDRVVPEWETEQLELGDRATGYVALVDLFPDSAGGIRAEVL